MKWNILKTSDGSEIEITQDMFEDFYVLSQVYGMSVKDIINHFLEAISGPSNET